MEGAYGDMRKEEGREIHRKRRCEDVLAGQGT